MLRAGCMDAVLLIAFGGPTRPEEVQPFLDKLLEGRPVPPARVEQVVRHYHRIGGKSPMNERTLRQAQALSEELRRQGRDDPIYVGMRNWTPFLSEAMQRMVDEGRRDVLGIVLAPHRSEASWERYLEAVEQARKAAGADSVRIRYAGPWHIHSLFVEAICERVKAAMDGWTAVSSDTGGNLTPDLHLFFTAHSVPVSMDRASGYASQVTETAAAVAKKLGIQDWSVVYQSRSGNPSDRWLEPDINDALREHSRAGTRKVLVIPVGFLCDHVEVLYDLDVQAHETARECGIEFRRASTVDDHPAFIRMLADLVARDCG